MVEYAVVGWKEKLGEWEIEVCITEKKGQSWQNFVHCRSP